MGSQVWKEVRLALHPSRDEVADAVGWTSSELLYASTEPVQDTQRGNANMYEPFRVMNDAITERVARLLSEDIPDEGSTPGLPPSATCPSRNRC